MSTRLPSACPCISEVEAERFEYVVFHRASLLPRSMIGVGDRMVFVVDAGYT
jgi:hypothetical protein